MGKIIKICKICDDHFLGIKEEEDICDDCEYSIHEPNEQIDEFSDADPGL